MGAWNPRPGKSQRTVALNAHAQWSNSYPCTCTGKACRRGLPAKHRWFKSGKSLRSYLIWEQRYDTEKDDRSGKYKWNSRLRRTETKRKHKEIIVIFNEIEASFGVWWMNRYKLIAYAMDFSLFAKIRDSRGYKKHNTFRFCCARDFDSESDIDIFVDTEKAGSQNEVTKLLSTFEKSETHENGASRIEEFHSVKSGNLNAGTLQKHYHMRHSSYGNMKECRRTQNITSCLSWTFTNERSKKSGSGENSMVTVRRWRESCLNPKHFGKLSGTR